MAPNMICQRGRSANLCHYHITFKDNSEYHIGEDDVDMIDVTVF